MPMVAAAPFSAKLADASPSAPSAPSAAIGVASVDTRPAVIPWRSAVTAVAAAWGLPSSEGAVVEAVVDAVGWRAERRAPSSGAPTAGPSILPTASAVTWTPLTAPTLEGAVCAAALLVAAKDAVDAVPEAALPMAMRRTHVSWPSRGCIASAASVRGTVTEYTTAHTSSEERSAKRTPKWRMKRPCGCSTQGSIASEALARMAPSIFSSIASPPAPLDAASQRGTTSNMPKSRSPDVERTRATRGSGWAQSTGASDEVARVEGEEEEGGEGGSEGAAAV